MPECVEPHILSGLSGYILDGMAGDWDSVVVVWGGVNSHQCGRSGKSEQKPLCIDLVLLRIWFRQNTDSKTHSTIRAKVNHLIWREVLYIHLTFRWNLRCQSEVPLEGNLTHLDGPNSWPTSSLHLTAFICSFAVYFSHNPLSALWRSANSISVNLRWPYSHLTYTSIEDLESRRF